MDSHLSYTSLYSQQCSGPQTHGFRKLLICTLSILLLSYKNRNEENAQLSHTDRKGRRDKNGHWEKATGSAGVKHCSECIVVDAPDATKTTFIQANTFTGRRRNEVGGKGTTVRYGDGGGGWKVKGSSDHPGKPSFQELVGLLCSDTVFLSGHSCPLTAAAAPAAVTLHMTHREHELQLHILGV